ncbi:phosphoribosylanthranilate isomerase [Blastopirellula marina]|uniref:N-(5'-phosphoribosyl)anthranilate isomerase n=1 Tax=Blastopirellula marina TaxID=124 RepID=A0A2S8GJ17_9BACT|nr:phosphoribosylanthranilate isomerase [Blastopirellula marina]PQO44416.1 N-(5'-phosphoribosyl)anthranilate isomerase [Blastopirellula marina]
MSVPEMFRIKICGLNDFENAIAVAHSGADAIGLNFFPGSKRKVDIETAERIANTVRGEVQLVGLFVNADHDTIAETHRRIGLDWIQLHGDESESFAETIYKELNVPIMAASRGSLVRWETLPGGFHPHALLMDAAVPGVYGGTGELSDWQLAATWHTMPGISRLVLAGGLTQENVAQAIHDVQPSAVDVAGGVEAAGQPGVKDLAKVEAFVATAHKAFAAQASS